MACSVTSPPPHAATISFLLLPMPLPCILVARYTAVAAYTSNCVHRMVRRSCRSRHSALAVSLTSVENPVDTASTAANSLLVEAWGSGLAMPCLRLRTHSSTTGGAGSSHGSGGPTRAPDFSL